MRFGKLRNKGAAIILVAGITLGFLLLFAVLAIDFSRMYYVRGELQNAADAGALAGAKVLVSTGGTTQALARSEAQKFAGLNKAAGQFVQTELNSGNDAAGDIVVGNWDASLSPKFSETRLPVNAVKVVARRTSASPVGGISVGSNPVGFIFGKLISGLSSMGVVREAIASFTLNEGPLPICVPSCSLATPLTAPSSCSDTSDPNCFPGTALCLNSAMTTPGLAYTNFQPQPQSGVCPSCASHQPIPADVVPFINGSQSPPNVCSQYICTKQGNPGPIMVALTDRWLDERAKPSGTVPIHSDTVQGWHTVVPVVEAESCGSPPGACPGAPGGTPYFVSMVSEVVITYVGSIGVPGCNFGIKVVGLDCPASDPTCSSHVSLLGCTSCSSPLPTVAIGPAKLVK